jgi:hypothetical protein
VRGTTSSSIAVSYATGPKYFVSSDEPGQESSWEHGFSLHRSLVLFVHAARYDLQCVVRQRPL